MATGAASCTMGSMSDSPYAAGVYRKGDQVRVADTASDAVNAVFDGFTLDPAGASESDQVENGDAPDTSGDDVSTDDEPGASGTAAGLFTV